MMCNILTFVTVFVIIGGSTTSKYPCNIHLSVNVDNGTLYENGSLIHNEIEYPQDLHFIYNLTDGHKVHVFNSTDFTEEHRRGCICQLKNCYRKCCPLNQSMIGDKCSDSNIGLDENVTDFAGNHLPNTFETFVPVFDVPCLEYDTIVIGSQEYSFLQDGSFVFDNEVIDISEYCIEKGLNEMGDIITIGYFCNEIETETFPIRQVKHILDALGMILSLPFLLATLVVYIILPELQTLNGKSLMCYIGSLTIGYSVLIAIKLSTDIRDQTCITLGFAAYSSFMLSFFWLNIISYDIWWTFSGFKGYRGRALTSEKRKFMYFCVYAFGATLLTSVITLALHFDSNVPDHYKSGIGESSCWFRDTSILPYFYGPLIFLTAWNLFFFSFTAYKIYSNTRLTGVLRREGSTKHGQSDSDKQRFWLYIKLFLIMGVTWTMEFMSWAVQGPTWAWVITDIINTLQGVLIFMFFVWKPKIRRLLRKKIKSWRNKNGNATSYSTGSTSFSKSNPTQISMKNLSRMDSSVPEVS